MIMIIIIPVVEEIGDIEIDPDGEINTAQNQVLKTKCNATKISQRETNNKCRLWQTFDETEYHII